MVLVIRGMRRTVVMKSRDDSNWPRRSGSGQRGEQRSGSACIQNSKLKVIHTTVDQGDRTSALLYTSGYIEEKFAWRTLLCNNLTPAPRGR